MNGHFQLVALERRGSRIRNVVKWTPGQARLGSPVGTCHNEHEPQGDEALGTGSSPHLRIRLSNDTPTERCVAQARGVGPTSADDVRDREAIVVQAEVLCGEILR